jgi:peptidoglycan/xylan/chitin deacetylase (PgdA/CDA1 family)
MLAYHGVGSVPLRDDPHHLFTRPDALVRQIGRLRRWGYRFRVFSELAALAHAGRADGHVALTFDDGMADNLSLLVPLLAREEVPATVFVCTGLLGGRHPDAPNASMLSPAGVQELACAGIEVGSHGSRHHDLTRLPEDAARGELAEAKAVLEDLVQRSVDVAAYPFGAADEVTRRACRDAGYTAACRTSGQGSWDDPWDLPRQDMGNERTLLGLHLKRADRYEPLVRRPVGRVVRGLARRARLLVG